jgi:hypothetical protein
MTRTAPGKRIAPLTPFVSAWERFMKSGIHGVVNMAPIDAALTTTDSAGKVHHSGLLTKRDACLEPAKPNVLRPHVEDSYLHDTSWRPAILTAAAPEERRVLLTDLLRFAQLL